MRLLFIGLLMFDADPENKGGGFTPAEKGELKEALVEVKTAIEKGVKAEVEGMLKKHQDTINEAVTKFTDFTTKKDETDAANQKALDEVLIKFKDMQASGTKTSLFRARSLQEA